MPPAPTSAPDLFLIDNFTDGPHSGNPAAVVLLEAPADPGWMQRVAQEMNQSETAFVWPLPPPAGAPPPPEPEWALRWFTPRTEVDLCGHATLAAAHALWESPRLSRSLAAVFRTKSGLLQAWSVPPSDGQPAQAGAGDIELDLPAEPEQEVTLTQEISRAFRLPPRYLGKNRLDTVIELESESAVRSVRPDMDLLLAAGGRGFIVTARAKEDRPYDFVLRYFAPAVGVPEDAVTGSAFCLLGPYWALRLGKDDLVGRQVSERGGTVRVRTTESRVRLGGRARTFLRGTLQG